MIPMQNLLSISSIICAICIFIWCGIWQHFLKDKPHNTIYLIIGFFIIAAIFDTPFEKNWAKFKNPKDCLSYYATSNNIMSELKVDNDNYLFWRRSYMEVDHITRRKGYWYLGNKVYKTYFKNATIRYITIDGKLAIFIYYDKKYNYYIEDSLNTTFKNGEDSIDHKFNTLFAVIDTVPKNYYLKINNEKVVLKIKK